MEKADAAARRLARSALVWYGGGLAFGIALAVLLVAGTIRTILYPIRAVTESAAAIGAGNLDQLVPITSGDELGQLASSFNSMARQLRDLRQSQHAQLIRAQQTSQATIDSFPDPVLVVDPQQRVEMANPAARRLLGVRPRDDRRTPAAAWEPPEALRQPLVGVLRQQHEYLPEGFDKAVVLRLGEQPRSFLPRILPIRDSAGATLGAAVLLEDITRFRLLDEVKSNLVATVSHELKTPLTSIRLVLAPAAGGARGTARAEAARTAGRCPRQRRTAAGDDQQPARPGPAGAGADPAPLAAGAAGGVVAGRRRVVPPPRRRSRRGAGPGRRRRGCPPWRSMPTSSSTPCTTSWTTP